MKYVFNSIYKYFKTTDTVLFILTILLSLFGMLMVYSATLSQSSDRTILMQAVAIFIGVCLMIFISKIDYHTLAGLWKFIGIFAIFLLVLTLIIGHGRADVPEKAWLDIAGYSLQPSELVKIAFIMTFAKHLDYVKENINSPVNVLLLLIHALVPIGFIIKQGDMGMTLVYIFIFVCMLFTANLKMRYFIGTAILSIIVSPIAWYNLATRQTGRILALFNPDAYPKQSWQQLQGRAALASGELWGYGLFNGPKTQSPYITGVLPEKQNDMIFAVIGEELGFIGCMVIVILLVVLLMKILLTARASKDMLGSAICIGVFSAFAIQIITNIGMCLTLLPIIGLTLPFISSGGSSLLSAFMAMGLVLSVYNNSSSLLFSNQPQ